MAVFVLVPGGWLGGWAWREVADELLGRGHRVVPVTLTGMGDRRHLVTPDTDLGTHVEDVVQVLDHEELTDVVLVGHSYGIFPTVGAADRRADSVRRVVFLDTGVPQDGQTVQAAFIHGDRLTSFRHQVATRGEGVRFPLPDPDDLPLWGSLDGLDAAALARLRRLAAPQPLSVYTDPLRLTGAVWQLPASGVFCTANGASIAVVEAMYATGDPLVTHLVDAGATFFELPTGHYPMLSTPLPLADVLVDAAEGRGRRLAAAPG